MRAAAHPARRPTGMVFHNASCAAGMASSQKPNKHLTYGSKPLFPCARPCHSTHQYSPYKLISTFATLTLFPIPYLCFTSNLPLRLPAVQLLLLLHFLPYPIQLAHSSVLSFTSHSYPLVFDHPPRSVRSHPHAPPHSPPIKGFDGRCRGSRPTPAPHRTFPP